MDISIIFMYTGFLILVSLHAFIHLLGFAKAIGWLKNDDLKTTLSVRTGWFWVIAFCFFVPVIILFAWHNRYWWIPALAAVFISQWLIISFWKDARFGTIANVIILSAALIAYGSAHFYNKFKSQVTHTLQLASVDQSNQLTESDLVSLPDPVKRYLRYAGTLGKPKVTNFRVEFAGEIRKDSASAWMPFTSVQYNFMEPASRFFFMNAAMFHLPVTGFHSYSDQHVFMDIRLLSLLKVQYQAGREMRIAETVTFFNDMCCMAPATLIDKRISWLESDSASVSAAFTNNGIRIQARLYFNDEGALINFTSDDRYAAGKDGSMKKLHWSTPLRNYVLMDHYRVAGEAKTIYRYPEGDLTYGRFRTVRVSYNVMAFDQ